jgi:hypothetical protein
VALPSSASIVACRSTVTSVGQVDVRKGWARVRATAERGRILLVLLLALLGTASAIAPARADAAEGRPAVLGVLAPCTPATHHDLRDRLAVAGRHALSTPLPDSWWAVCARAAGSSDLPDPALAGDTNGPAVALGVAAAPSTRAPPPA